VLAPNEVTRRKFLLNAGHALSASLFFSSACSLRSSDHGFSRELNIYNWADYIHPEVVPEFEKRYGIRINYDTFASNEALLAKLEAGATKYDIVVPSDLILRQLVKLDLLQPINHDRLTNLGNLMPRFLSPPSDPLLTHSVPYMWGTTGIAYNLDAAEHVLAAHGFPFSGFEQKGWELFWDERFSGRMTLLDDEREALGMSLKRLGCSYNSHARTEISKSKDELLRQKPLLMCYTTEQVIVQLASGDSWLAQAFSGDVYQAARSNSAIRYFIPEQGASTWLDSFCIPKYATHPDAAHLWINFMLEPEVSARNAEYTRYATANKIAFDRLDERVRFDKHLYPPPGVIDRCEEIVNAGGIASYYDRMWTELKCA
jgi:spermidine/putrescine transport system substrate-binding protein